MASEVSSMLWNQVAERASAKEEASILRAELDSRTLRLETEKNELQSVLEKELDRRSSDWSLKLEKYQIEQHRLRERASELAEQNVSLQREVSSFNEKEVDNRIKMSFSEKHLEDLSKRIEQVSEENKNLRQQLTQLQVEYRVAQDNRDYVRENYKEKVKELKSETLLTTMLREKLYSEEMDIKQLQADLAAIVRGNDILKCEVQNALDALSYATPKLKYLELQVLKKDENINQLTNDLQECMKELGVVKAILPKVFRERDFMWEEIKSYSEMSMLFNYEINMLKRKEVALEGTSIDDIVHQNSTCGAAENVATAAKPNGIMHEPVRADRPNVFSNNSSSVLSCIQTAVDIPSQTAGPSTFELPDHAIVGPGRKGGVRVGESPTLLGSELPKILSLHNQPSFLTLETDRAAVENVFNLKGIRALHLGLLYVGSLVVLLVYSILYGLTAKESNWLGATTSAAVIILRSSFPTYWNLGACLYGFKLLKSQVAVLFVAGTSRVFLICFGVHYWYFGHCISYAVVASVLLGAAVSRHLSVTDPLAARRDALQSTVIRLREGFRKKDQNSSASSSEGCGSSVKRSSADAGHLGNATVPGTGDGSTWNNIERINSDKSIDSGRPSLAPRTSSCRSVVHEPEVGSSYVDRNLEHNSSLVVCSSSGLESQGGDSSTSTSANQQILDLNLALALQEKLSDPRITSMLKRKGRHTDRELANLLQDKGLDPNFAVMLKENGLDTMMLALLQRSSLDADREHRDSNPPVTDSNDVEDVLPNHISFSEELRLQGLGKWLQHCRVMLHDVAGTPERAWLLFSLIFILETVVVAIFRP
ncbi:hypothetical protein T459_31592 [Capsicum annuum]|uniref:Calpain-type cysteine protease DEK1 n=1 Tax=Capsicum annuum TaxID=4072 RepID=A0A2G2YBN5_CAPAN|nr:hypothetical protein T459_31592 [Capsicum annuum]